MKKVDALIIGAGRSGTTTLYQYLDDHEDVCFSKIKEVHYFSLEDLYKRGNSYYENFFYPTESQKLLTADTYLFIDKQAPERIKKYNPEMKLIIMLRDPITRAYSGYQYALNNGYMKDSVSFREAIDNEKHHIQKSDIIAQNNLCNLYQSKYYEHISYWMQFFSKDQFLILQTKDLKENRIDLLNKLADFLDISKFNTDSDQVQANKAAKTKSKVLQQFLLNRNNPMRIMLRKILPKKVKTKILHSGISEKLMKINRRETAYMPLSESHKEYCKEVLKEDLQLLKNEYGIYFTE